MNLFYQPGIKQGVLYLDAEESKHCTRVLRKKKGDIIDITDGKGSFYEAVIVNDNQQQCTFEIKKEVKRPARSFHIHIAISPTKNPDRVEWFVEKAVELGVDAITFITCEHTERIRLKTERIQKIAVSAMKQSLKATLPVVHGPIALTSFFNILQATHRFIAYVDTTNPDHLMHTATRSASYCVLIGPEGDFTPEELAQAQAAGYRKVSLGESRLRTETAGLAACHILNLINL